MTDTAIIPFEWTGEAMVPVKGFARRADDHFVVHERYRMEVQELRSWVSHKHEFAWLREAWLNLPEQYRDEQWAQSEQHLRRYALIKKGWCDTQTFVCGSRAEAERWAANLRPIDEFSIVRVQGSTVVRYVAKSQSQRAMGKADFQKSKTDVLDFVSGLIGVTPEDLVRQGEAA